MEVQDILDELTEAQGQILDALKKLNQVMRRTRDLGFDCEAARMRNIINSIRRSAERDEDEWRGTQSHTIDDAVKFFEDIEKGARGAMEQSGKARSSR